MSESEGASVPEPREGEAIPITHEFITGVLTAETFTGRLRDIQIATGYIDSDVETNIGFDVLVNPSTKELTYKPFHQVVHDELVETDIAGITQSTGGYIETALYQEALRSGNIPLITLRSRLVSPGLPIADYAPFGSDFEFLRGYRLAIRQELGHDALPVGAIALARNGSTDMIVFQEKADGMPTPEDLLIYDQELPTLNSTRDLVHLLRQTGYNAGMVMGFPTNREGMQQLPNLGFQYKPYTR